MKKLTDEEYIKKLKKEERNRKKYTIFLIIVLSLFLVPIIYYTVLIYSGSQELLSNLESGNATLENEAIAYVEKNEKFLWGFTIGSAISGAYIFFGVFIGLLIRYYFSGRKERMLIKYYELSNNKNIKFDSPLRGSQFM